MRTDAALHQHDMLQSCHQIRDSPGSIQHSQVVRAMTSWLNELYMSLTAFAMLTHACRQGIVVMSAPPQQISNYSS